MPDEWMLWEDARQILGVSRDKMTKLVKTGVIESRGDPLDGRRVLIKRSSVEAVKAQSVPRTRKED